MKFINFELMPYRDLPWDFAEHNRSIWVDIDPTLFDPEVGHWTYNDYLDMLEYSDRMGFDGIGVNEHHSNGYGLQASPNLMAATLSRATRNAAILIGGNSLALYNPPIRVAEELAMLDVISGGRIIAGFPVGTPMDTTFAYGVNPATLRERYEEAMELVIKSWTAKTPFSYNGHFNKLRYVNVWPRPIQQPHPPVWIPGGGSVDTWEWCARQELVFLYLSFFGFKLAKRNFDSYWTSVREAGKDPNPYKAGFAQGILVADTEKEAREMYREGLEYFFNVCRNVYDGFADPPGYKTTKSLRSGVEGMVERLGREARERKAYSFHKKGLSADEGIDKGYVIVGSPTQVTEQLHELARTLNVGHLICMLHQGNMDRELSRHNIEMFATKVIPDLRSMFDDRWEDRWWPQPLPANRRVLPDAALGPRSFGAPAEPAAIAAAH
jgi:alkanesulfonate monooxygenase SsuD/methylene tetrahydromethanopterin reductase-like flavin-dependent oxidoreductase (luciferase family)